MRPYDAHSSEVAPIFVMDRVLPRLGMERAAHDLFSILPVEIKLLVISGGESEFSSNVRPTYFGLAGGWKGRIASIRVLRRELAQLPHESPVVAVGVWAFIPTALCMIFKKRRAIIWEHSILPWRLRNERRVLAAALIARGLARKCQKVISVSNASSRSSSSVLARSADYITIANPNLAVPPTSLAAEPTRSHSHLTSLVGVGSLIRRKNWQLSIRAMKLLPDQFTLDIAGSGPEQVELQSLIDQLNLGDRVTLRGYVENASHLLPGAAALVHPSYAETFGYVFFEAAQAGTPIVALNMPIMNEIIPSQCYGLCSSDSPEAFAKAIRLAAAFKGHQREPHVTESGINAEIVHNWLSALRPARIK